MKEMTDSESDFGDCLPTKLLTPGSPEGRSMPVTMEVKGQLSPCVRSFSVAFAGTIGRSLCSGDSMASNPSSKASIHVRKVKPLGTKFKEALTP